MDALSFILAMLLGGFAAWQLVRAYYAKKYKKPERDLVTESHILLERIEKVFKVVLAEGYFTEIYDHKAKKDFFGLFKTNSKALVVARAKVAVGFDFAKMQIRRNPETRTLVIEQFAEAEIIAIDTEYKFYDINQGLLNKFDNDDYTAILAEAKNLMRAKAYESDLPQIAQQQIQVMMQQLCASSGWQLEQPTLLEPLKTLDKDDAAQLGEHP
jgi:hypothetical protein